MKQAPHLKGKPLKLSYHQAAVWADHLTCPEEMAANPLQNPESDKIVLACKTELTRCDTFVTFF